jgi:serine/threonine-protein kinase
MANSPARSGLDVGSVIADTYTIEAMIGRGGMGAVFVASHARLPGKKVAIKVLHPDVADPESLVRFRREAEIASRLGHPNIVDVLDWNALPDGTPYLVLEFLNGEPLSSRLARGPLPLEQVFAITRQVASALAAAHAQDIVHRDLKPQNVFLVPSEADGYATERAKVLDFGISKIRGSQTVKTQDTAILGTPQYMAPEQATGNHAAVDPRTDVFALGAMVYEMISGVGAFAGSSIPEVVFKVVYEEPTRLEERVPGVPAHVAAAVHKALSKKQDERFPSVAAFVEALTGSPLATVRRGIAMAPADGATPSMRTRQAEDPALAATMGSGDHAKELGVAKTMATGSGAVAGAGGATVPVAPNPAVATTPTLSRPPRGKTGLILGLAVIVAGAAIAIAVIVMNGKKAEQAEQAGSAVASGSGSGAASASGRAVAAGSGSGAASASGSAVASGSGSGTATVAVAGSGFASGSGSGSGSGSAHGSGSASGSGAHVVHKEPKNGSGSGSVVATTDEHEHHEEPSAGSGTGTGEPEDGPRDLIAQAEAAMRDNDVETAIKLANKITSQQPGNPAAWAIKTRAFCTQQDREKALAALRHLEGKPIVRKRALHACKQLGMDLEQ